MTANEIMGILCFVLLFFALALIVYMLAVDAWRAWRESRGKA